MENIHLKITLTEGWENWNIYIPTPVSEISLHILSATQAEQLSEILGKALLIEMLVTFGNQKMEWQGKTLGISTGHRQSCTKGMKMVGRRKKLSISVSCSLSWFKLINAVNTSSCASRFLSSRIPNHTVLGNLFLLFHLRRLLSMEAAPFVSLFSFQISESSF